MPPVPAAIVDVLADVDVDTGIASRGEMVGDDTRLCGDLCAFVPKPGANRGVAGTLGSSGEWSTLGEIARHATRTTPA
jgi:hypothetical protein